MSSESPRRRSLWGKVIPYLKHQGDDSTPRSFLYWLAALTPFGFLLVLGDFQRLLPFSSSWMTVTLYDWQRVDVTAALIFSLAVALLAGHGRLRLVPGIKTSLSVFFILLLGALSVVINGQDAWIGFREVGNVGLLAASFVSLGSSLPRVKHWQAWVVACLAGSALLYALAFLELNSYTLFFPEFMEVEISLPIFSNIRFLSDYQALVLPFLVVLIGRCRSGPARWSAWTAAFLFAMVFYYTGSRAMVLGQVGAHLVLWIVLGKRYRVTFYRHVGTWCGGYVLFFVFSWLIPNWLLGQQSALVTPLLRGGLSAREGLWQLAWTDMLKHPLLGIGPGEFSRQFNTVAAAPHNGLLMLGAEWGVPVMLAALTLLWRGIMPRLGALRAMLENKDGRLDFAMAAWLAFAALLLHSLVANVWVVPTSQLSMLLSAVLFYVSVPMPLNATASACARTPSAAMFGWVTLSVGSALWMAIVIASELPQLPARNQQYVDCPRPTLFFSPRFWQQGWLTDGCLPKEWANNVREGAR